MGNIADMPFWCWEKSNSVAGDGGPQVTKFSDSYKKGTFEHVRPPAGVQVVRYDKQKRHRFTKTCRLNR